jgi:hypothetical protein
MIPNKFGDLGQLSLLVLPYSYYGGPLLCPFSVCSPSCFFGEERSSLRKNHRRAINGPNGSSVVFARTWDAGGHSRLPACPRKTPCGTSTSKIVSSQSFFLPHISTQMPWTCCPTASRLLCGRHVSCVANGACNGLRLERLAFKFHRKNIANGFQ